MTEIVKLLGGMVSAVVAFVMMLAIIVVGAVLTVCASLFVLLVTLYEDAPRWLQTTVKITLAAFIVIAASVLGWRIILWLAGGAA